MGEIFIVFLIGVLGDEGLERFFLLREVIGVVVLNRFDLGDKIEG